MGSCHQPSVYGRCVAFQNRIPALSIGSNGSCSAWPERWVRTSRPITAVATMKTAAHTTCARLPWKNEDITGEAPPQTREHVRGRMAPPRQWQHLFARALRGRRRLARRNLTQDSAFEAVKTSSEAEPQTGKRVAFDASRVRRRPASRLFAVRACRMLACRRLVAARPDTRHERSPRKLFRRPASGNTPPTTSRRCDEARRYGAHVFDLFRPLHRPARARSRAAASAR